MDKLKNLLYGLTVSASLLLSSGCSVVIRDTETYKNEVYLLQMAIEQDTELLAEHLADGSCSCDEDGNWNNDVCEMSALNVTVMRKRLDWHVAMMMFLGGLSKEDPGEEPPVSAEEISELCPK